LVVAMLSEGTNPAACNCLALRQAARHVTQFYDQFLVPSGLRSTQYSILARLQRKGPMTISALAAELVMDRTTLGRNILRSEEHTSELQSLLGISYAVFCLKKKN
jgi:DNA-binding MarR family transcriptional regulator